MKKVSPREGRRENAQLDRGGKGGRERDRGYRGGGDINVDIAKIMFFSVFFP